DYDPKIMELLLDHGADVNAVDDSTDSTLLMTASLNGDDVMAALLVDRGALLNEKDCNGDTALHRAAQHNHAEVVQILVEAGDNTRELNSDGKTARQLAEFSAPEAEKILKITELSLEEKLDEMTYAIKKGDLEEVRLWLDNGVDPNALYMGSTVPLLMEA